VLGGTRLENLRDVGVVGLTFGRGAHFGLVRAVIGRDGHRIRHTREPFVERVRLDVRTVALIEMSRGSSSVHDW
jgi:hypothetical protein